MSRRLLLSISAFLALAVPSRLAADERAPRDLHLDLTLRSGERVAGSGADRRIYVATGRDLVELALSRVRRIDANGDGETVTVRTADGATMRGVLEAATLEVLPTRATSVRRIETSEIVALGATPRLRIAGSGDAWWDLELVRARGWQVENDEDRLRVRNIDPETVNGGSHCPWSTVRLSRDVASFGDFALTAGLSWDDGGAGTWAMQDLYVTLLDADGYEIACAGHHDAWSATTGSRYSRLVGTAWESGYGTQPASGRGEIRIVRADGRLRVLFDGEERQQCVIRAPVARVVVQVDFYAYAGPDGRSVFGTTTLERLEIR